MLPTGHLLTFAAISFALIAVPGPNVLFVISRSLMLGRAAGVGSAVGGQAGVYVQVAAGGVGIGGPGGGAGGGDVSAGDPPGGGGKEPGTRRRLRQPPCQMPRKCSNALHGLTLYHAQWVTGNA